MTSLTLPPPEADLLCLQLFSPFLNPSLVCFKIINDQLDPATTRGRLVMLTAPRPRGLHVTFATVRANVLFHLGEKNIKLQLDIHWTN